MFGGDLAEIASVLSGATGEGTWGCPRLSDPAEA